MYGVSPITWLLIALGATTTVFVALVIWRGLAGMREDDQIFLDEAEAGMAAEQREIIAKVERITMYAKGFGYTSAALLIVLAGLWIYQGFVAFNRPPMP